MNEWLNMVKDLEVSEQTTLIQWITETEMTKTSRLVKLTIYLQELVTKILKYKQHM